MKIKLYPLLIILLTVSSTGFSQSTTFGLRGGVNFSGSYIQTRGNYYATRPRTGFNAGVNAEVPLPARFFLQPGLLYSMKGATDYERTYTTRLSYIELPVNLVFKTDRGPGQLILGAGPYLAAGIDGSNRERATGKVNRIRFRNDLTVEEWLDNDEGAQKRLDIGANVLAGYEFKNGFSLQLNGQLGLTDNAPTIEGQRYFYRNGTLGWGISVGYRFRK